MKEWYNRHLDSEYNIIIPLNFFIRGFRGIVEGKGNMRLIDADKLSEELNSFSMRITGSANAMALAVMHETKKSIAKMIDEQQTIDVEKILVCNCKDCKNNNTDKCMHCMRAYTDCYEL